MKARYLRWLMLVCLSPACPDLLAQPGGTNEPTYKSGYSSMIRLGADIYRALQPDHQKLLSPHPVMLETGVMPYVKPMEVKYDDDPQPIRGVFVSAGFVDLVNFVAHAKAIDRLDKGYFRKYVASLSRETGETWLSEIPRISDRRYWADSVMNEQLSNFNQMAGMIVAIELAHHYLGHYRKYADKLTDTRGGAVPIKNLLTESEWEAALEAGARNALNGGLGVEGLQALYECIDQMPQRPAWTAYFLPVNARVSKINRELERIQNRSFMGR